MATKACVLITASRSFPALHLARTFGAAGHQVFSADSRTGTVTEASKYVEKHFLLPAPVENPEAHVARVSELVREHGIDFIIPTCEEGFFLSQHRDLLPEGCRLFSDSVTKLEAFHNKFTFSLISAEDGVRSPETHLLRSTEEVDPFRQEPAAWVFKPIFSRFSAFTLISPHREDLGKVTATPSNPWVAQKRILGKEFSCYGIAHGGGLVAFSAYETPYRLGQGGGVYLVNRSHQTPEILQFVTSFVKRYEYTGQIAFDFIQDETGDLRVIECNPRATNGVWMFAEHQPVDAFLLDGTEAPGEVALASYGMPRMIGAVMRLYCAPKAYRQGELRAWARAYRHGKDLLFSWRDPKPYLSRFRGLRRFRALRAARRRGENVLNLTSSDMDWSNPRFGETYESKEQVLGELSVGLQARTNLSM